ncbi:MAG: SCP2 sterol-binding domain-containing protein [Bacteroidia bacterium]|nr:SCP2 sterol-binding domain-containing protein [Bacteroidia bacterium]
MMNLESAQEKVREKLFATNPDIPASFKFDFGDKVIFVDNRVSPPEINREDQEADCTIHLTLEDLHELLDGKLSPVTAFTTGKMRIDGDMGVAMRLSALFA